MFNSTSCNSPWQEPGKPGVVLVTSGPGATNCVTGLLTALMDRAKADHPRVRNVTLAVDLARHSSNGWDDPALPDDFAAIENLLHISHESLLRKLGLDIAGGSAAKERGSGSEPIIQ